MLVDNEEINIKISGILKKQEEDSRKETDEEDKDGYNFWSDEEVEYEWCEFCESQVCLNKSKMTV